MMTEQDVTYLDLGMSVGQSQVFALVASGSMTAQAVPAYIRNGYFLNRFDSAFSRKTAPMISAALFSGFRTGSSCR